MKTPEQQKKEIQGEIDKLAKEISDLTKRRGDLLAKRDSLALSIETQKTSIEDALLDGRDTGPSTDALARDKALLESLGGAINQAEQKLADLNIAKISIKILKKSKKKPPTFFKIGGKNKIRQRLTLPHGNPCSTISASDGIQAYG